jgi:molybdenum cofactor cytidylyltransferase
MNDKETMREGEGKVSAVVLAAGRSTRMGEFKPLMKLGGEMLVRRVVGTLTESSAIGEIIVVTGYRGTEVAEAVREMRNADRIRIVVNERYAEGEMISSVTAGMGAVARGTAGFVLAFADQPAVKAETVKKLVGQFLEHRTLLAVPVFQGRRGHPIVIGAGLMKEVQDLAPEETLRTVVRRHLGETRMVDVDDEAVLEDLDTPEDWARAKSRIR